MSKWHWIDYRGYVVMIISCIDDLGCDVRSFRRSLWRRNYWVGLLLVLLSAAVCGCSSEKEAGDPCDPSPAGAGSCSSNVCIVVDCVRDNTVSVCAGNECYCESDYCYDDICEAGEMCVQSTNDVAYCVPQEVCFFALTSGSDAGVDAASQTTASDASTVSDASAADATATDAGLAAPDLGLD